MALRTKRFTPTQLPFSSEILFEKILNLNEKLTGQSVKIKSILNPKDTDPSMIIFFDGETNIYRFKDFSADKYGDIIDLISCIYNLDRVKAYYKLLDICESKEFEGIEKINTSDVVKIETKITRYKIAQWKNRDEEYWSQYNISPFFLQHYNIKPIEKYEMTKVQGDKKWSYIFEQAFVYGYFTKDNKLYKIYSPKVKDNKFIKIKNNILQGEEQLKFEQPYLIMLSSMKDMGAFYALKFKGFEFVAPDSENTYINKDKIDFFKSKYKKIFTLFDNDIAGMKAMKKYQELYQIPYIHFNVEKDVAECVKQHGIESTRVFMKSKLQNAIRKEN
ncbi:MAG: hypothetical protein RIR01_2284 [Bacteroidota bacterium]|jgi:hypothetical protein